MHALFQALSSVVNAAILSALIRSLTRLSPGSRRIIKDQVIFSRERLPQSEMWYFFYDVHGIYKACQGNKIQMTKPRLYVCECITTEGGAKPDCAI